MVLLSPARLTADEIDELYQVCVSNRTYWEYSGDLDPDDLSREAVAAMLREEAVSGELLVAREDSGRTVGMAGVVRHPVDGHMWIGLLLVDGRLHRQGHGRAVAQALEERFREAGEAAVRLGVLATNAEARAFWTALGYHQIDLRPDRAKGRPTLVMHKDLHT